MYKFQFYRHMKSFPFWINMADLPMSYMAEDILRTWDSKFNNYLKFQNVEIW